MRNVSIQDAQQLTLCTAAMSLSISAPPAVPGGQLLLLLIFAMAHLNVQSMLHWSSAGSITIMATAPTVRPAPSQRFASGCILAFILLMATSVLLTLLVLVVRPGTRTCFNIKM